jgi:hypothetical protein
MNPWAEGPRSAALDRRHDLQLAEAHMAGVGRTPCRPAGGEWKTFRSASYCWKVLYLRAAGVLSGVSSTEHGGTRKSLTVIGSRSCETLPRAGALFPAQAEGTDRRSRKGFYLDQAGIAYTWNLLHRPVLLRQLT